MKLITLEIHGCFDCPFTLRPESGPVCSKTGSSIPLGFVELSLPEDYSFLTEDKFAIDCPLDDAAPDAPVDKGCVTISELEEIAKRHNYTHIVMLSIKPGNYQFVASYGESTLQADQAAQMANRLKDLLGWPESLHAIPDRVQTLFDKIKKYESILKTHDLGREAGLE